MPTLTELTRAVAKSARIPETEVDLYSRRLREARLLPKSTGRSYAQIGHRDCARLLTALLVAENARSAADAVKAWAPLVDQLTQILEHKDRGSHTGSVRVNRVSGKVSIEDRSGKAPKPGHFCGRTGKTEQPNSRLEFTATLADGVIKDLLSYLF